MNRLIKVTDKDIEMDKYLVDNLDILKREVRFNDWDNIILIDGMERCLSEDTKIQTSKGIETLGDINDKFITVKALDFKTSVEIEAEAEIIHSGLKEVYELELEDGSKVQATLDHKFFIREDGVVKEKKLKEIKEGDQIIKCKNEMYTEKVRSVRYIGKKQTYDLKVPIYNNFILDNDIVTHNSGKTVQGATIAYYLSYSKKRNKSTFNIDNIFWHPEQLERLIKTAPPNTTLLGDEFALVALSSEHMTKTFRTIIKHFTTIGKKNLHIVLVVPYIFMLHWYYAVARTRALIHVTTKQGFKRGYFKFYNYDEKRILYFKGKKSQFGYPTSCRYSFEGLSSVKNLSQLGIDQEDYERRKDKAMGEIGGTKQDKYKDRFFQVVGHVREQLNYEWKLLPKILGINMTWGAIQRGYSRYKDRLIDQKLDDAEKKRVRFKMP